MAGVRGGKILNPQLSTLHPQPIKMRPATGSFWYRLLFPKRSRIISAYIHSMNVALADTYDYVVGDKPWPNGLQTLLNVGAADLSAKAFNDVCIRLVDFFKNPHTDNGLSGSWQENSPYKKSTTSFFIPWETDPNPLYPMLPDKQVLPFLRYCKKYQLSITPLYNAAFEASRFLSNLPTVCYER
jgi:hypothetical protein